MRNRTPLPELLHATMLAACLLASGCLASACLAGNCAAQQHDPHTSTVDAAAAQSTSAAPRRTRLYLKDGSYQLVLSYKIVGPRVSYLSAERGGEQEDIPLNLVDLDRTTAWEKQHAPVDPNAPPAERPSPALDPELVKEEADRLALSPDVAPDLALDPEYGVLTLDTWHASPELVPLAQSQGELNHQTSHNIVRGIVNPLSTAHQVIQLKGERADAQLHVNDPVFYIKLDDELPASGQALTVDTHGASQSGKNRRRPDTSTYVIVRVDVRQDARVIASFAINALGTARRQEDVIETDATALPGGHWLKVVPAEKLLIGEYALLEVLSEREINLGVWDFGVHPTAPENRDTLKPEKRRPNGLARRPPP